MPVKTEVPLGEDILWLTPHEAARILRIRVDSLAKACTRGSFPARYVRRLPGGHRRYSRAYVESLNPDVPVNRLEEFQGNG